MYLPCMLFDGPIQKTHLSAGHKVNGGSNGAEHYERIKSSLQGVSYSNIPANISSVYPKLEQTVQQSNVRSPENKAPATFPGGGCSRAWCVEFKAGHILAHQLGHIAGWG